MNTIWKYELEFEAITRLQVPRDAEILTVQRDDKTNKPCVWIMVNTDNEKEERLFELFGTGHEIKWDMGVDRKYIGTYQYQKGEFVGHVFEYTGSSITAQRSRLCVVPFTKLHQTLNNILR